MGERIKSEAANYQLLECLGEGLSSCVYKAIREDSRGHSKHQVVLKILKSKNAVAWLRQEFVALAKVESRHCVRVLGWENFAEGPALVLEFIEGLTLYELARRRILSPECLEEICTQAEVGLRDLAAKGFHHGDLSPRNIMIDRQGTVKLLDFASIPLSGEELIGTPAYLAPEIWRGENPSLASDLFSLGLIVKDAASGFSEAPQTSQASRARAEKLNEGRWLKQNPLHREPAYLSSDSEAVQILAYIVHCELQAAVGPMQTQVLQNANDNLNRSYFRLSATLILFFALMLWPRKPDLRVENQNRPTAQLHVHTQAWVELYINGRALGYSPILISSIKAGGHRLHWRTAKSQGEMRIELSPGQILSLTDRDFRPDHKELEFNH